MHPPKTQATGLYAARMPLCPSRFGETCRKQTLNDILRQDNPATGEAAVEQANLSMTPERTRMDKTRNSKDLLLLLVLAPVSLIVWLALDESTPGFAPG